MTPFEEIDLYSPWREGGAALKTRHVGRESELDAIRAGALAFANGSSPLPLYVFGSSGIGKSHLLTLGMEAIKEVTSADEVIVTVVPEDAVSQRSAERLFEMMTGGIEPPPWAADSVERAPARGGRQRHIVVFEGLDRQLRALGTQGRRELRRLLGEAPDMWIVASGMTLPSELTMADEAFFGAFDPWPLDPLDDIEAWQLLDHVTGESEHDTSWRGLRRTLVTLSGGSPRTLVALGLARRQQRDRTASDLLHRVVHVFTPQYRNQLRSLSPQAQQIVTLLSAAPREMGPAELAAQLGSTTTQMSVQARRLLEDGVVRHRSDGRQTWYRLADPVFRYWLEYRSARWSQTRIAWIASLAAVMHNQSGPQSVTVSASSPPSWRGVREALLAAVSPTVDRGRADALLAEAAQLPLHVSGMRAVAELALTRDLGELVDLHLIHTLRTQPSMRDLVAVASLDRMLRARALSPRDAFMHFVNESTALLQPTTLAVLRFVLARAGHGRAWTLRSSERRALAARPMVRALFLRQGRDWSHPPLISPSEVVDGLEAKPVDAADLLATAAVLPHIELMRQSARALMRADAAMPRCVRPRVLDVDTSNIIARLMADSLERASFAATDPGARSHARVAARDALTWVASVASASDDAFERVLSRIEAIPLPYDDYLHEVALAALLVRDRERFIQVERAMSMALGEPYAQARRLAAQLSEAARGRLHPELAVVHRVVVAEDEALESIT